MDVFRESGIRHMAFSDTLECDGKTVLLSMMDDSEGTSVWIFPKEKPCKKDFQLWCTSLQHATLPSLTL